MSSHAALITDATGRDSTGLLASAPLHEQENVLAALSVDLNLALRFAAGVVIITNQRLIAQFPDETGWRSWDLHPGLQLAQTDHGGVGTLTLRDADSRLASWRC